MVADETFNVFGENASLGRVNVVIVAVSEGGGGKREGGRGKRQFCPEMALKSLQRF